MVKNTLISTSLVVLPGTFIFGDGWPLTFFRDVTIAYQTAS